MEDLIVETRIKACRLAELPVGLKALAEASLAAGRAAYAPYSGFCVGAAVLLDNGVVVTGNNQENAAYPSGLCAERVALFYAGSQYPGSAVCAIAVSAQTGGRQTDRISPCGACRQVLLETENRFQHPIKVLLCGAEKVYMAESAASLLPLSFGGSDLK
jgi:cytidine deaminase